MEGCIVPSEVPGVSKADREGFGEIAEDLIYMDFRSRYSYSPTQLYVDDHNESSYFYFLSIHNPHLQLNAFATVLRMSVKNDEPGPRLGLRRPDLLIHTFSEQVMYEIKPDSAAGLKAGIEKLGVLQATYKKFKLPYRYGMSYTPAAITVATAGLVQVQLKSWLAGPGLILYKLCLETSAKVDAATLAALLAYIIKQMNKQKGQKSFRPIDLQPAFAHEGQLSSLARALGLVMATGAMAVGWKYFWKAVAIRFAARGSAAALLAAADGPLPVGDLIAVGMAIWTVVDIIRLSNSLWSDAARLAAQGA